MHTSRVWGRPLLSSAKVGTIIVEEHKGLDMFTNTTRNPDPLCRYVSMVGHFSVEDPSALPESNRNGTDDSKVNWSIFYYAVNILLVVLLCIASQQAEEMTAHACYILSGFGTRNSNFHLLSPFQLVRYTELDLFTSHKNRNNNATKEGV